MENNNSRKKITLRQRPMITNKDFSFADLKYIEEPNDFLSNYRYSAYQVYKSTPFPTRQDEAWRRTDIRSLDVEDFSIIPKKKTQNIEKKALTSLPNSQEKLSGEVKVNPKKIHISLTDEAQSKGIICVDFKTAAKNHPEILKKVLGKVVTPTDGKFAALVSAFSSNGILLYVPKDVVINFPFKIQFSGSFKDLAILSHFVIWIEEYSYISTVFEYSSKSMPLSEKSFHAGITELHIGENANLNLVEIQDWGENVWCFMHEKAKIQKNGKLDWFYSVTGSHLTKGFINVDLMESGAEANLSGLYFTDHNQHIDLDTQQNHLAPATSSNLLYKGVITGNSKAIWQGMIFVSPNAIKTDGYQSNRNLLLSETASVNSIPGLEILADDVKCSHGATVSRIEETEMFYMQSRGIPQKEAERLIVKGFLDSLINDIPVEQTGAQISRIIEKKQNLSKINC